VRHVPLYQGSDLTVTLGQSAHHAFQSGTQASTKNIQKLSVFCRSLRPTAFHHALQTIAKQGRLQRVYSENVDGLEEAAGLSVFPFTCANSTDAQVIALHGSVHYLVAKADKCDHQSYHRGGDEVTDTVLNRGDKPPCPECEHRPGRRTRVTRMGALSHAILHFGEKSSSFSRQIKGACHADKDQADLLVIVGTAIRTRSVRTIINNFLSSLKSPKCLLIDIPEFSPSALPRSLPTVLQLDCQLLAAKLLQDNVMKSTRSVLAVIPEDMYKHLYISPPAVVDKFIYFLTADIEMEQLLSVSLKLQEIYDQVEYTQNLYQELLLVRD
jgi:NAD-dependent SIR2 family protein deacetylase